MKPFRPTHKTEIEAIRRVLSAAGAKVYVLHQSGRVFGSAGMPDIYVQVPHVLNVPYTCDAFAFWIEVKVGKDKLRREQVVFALTEAAMPPPHREVVVGGLLQVIDHYNSMRPNRKIAITG